MVAPALLVSSMWALRAHTRLSAKADLARVTLEVLYGHDARSGTDLHSSAAAEQKERWEVASRLGQMAVAMHRPTPRMLRPLYIPYRGRDRSFRDSSPTAVMPRT